MSKLELKDTQGGDNVIVEVSNNIVRININPETDDYDLPLNADEALKMVDFILERINA